MKRNAAPPVEVLAGLESYVVALANASEVLSRFTDGITTDINDNVESYSLTKAWEIYFELMAISAKLTGKDSDKNVVTISRIGNLIDWVQDSNAPVILMGAWGNANAETRESLYLLKKLFDQINQNMNHFVVRDGYGNLLSTLTPVGNSTVPVYKFLSPAYPAAVEVLARWGKNYNLLVTELDKAIKEIFLYIEKQ